MASLKVFSAQTLREIREIGRPIEVVNKNRQAILLQVPRLRSDLIKMADDREVGRYRGAMRRLIAASEVENKDKSKDVRIAIILPTEANWLKQCKELSNSFNFKYPTGQRRAAHMITHAQQEAFQLLDGKDDIDWFLLGWEERINKRLAPTDERVILGLSTVTTRENGTTSTLFFTVVPVAEYEAWIDSNKATT